MADAKQSAETSTSNSLVHFQDELLNEEPFEFIALTTIFREVPDEQLLGLDLQSGNFILTTKDGFSYRTLNVSIDQTQLNSLSSLEEAIDFSNNARQKFPEIPEWLPKKLQTESMLVAALGDMESAIGQIVNKLSNSNDSDFIIVTENLKDIVYSYDWQSNERSVVLNALQLLTVMEHFGIQSIHYRPTEKEFPINDSFADWPDTIASLYFFLGGGFTVSPVSDQTPTQGYVVALEGHSRIVPAEDFFSGPVGHEYGRQIMKEYLSENALEFLKPSIYFGGWHDPRSDLIFLDLSEVVLDLDEAIQLAIERDQIAIYDLSNGTTIDTGGSGGITLMTLPSFFPMHF